MQFKDRTGETYGRLTVISLVSRGKHNRWLCLCDCGNKKEVDGNHLVSGATSSCGCLRKELTSVRQKTHGYSITRPLSYRIWKAMLARVRSNLEPYGGRGIGVDPDWQVFENFLADMGEPPEGYSIERKDVNLGYCKSNCEWIHRSHQNYNKRNTVRFTLDGETITAQALSKVLEIKVSTLYARARNDKIHYTRAETHVRGKPNLAS